MRWMDARRKEGRKASEAKPYLDLFQHNKSRTKKNDAKRATDVRSADEGMAHGGGCDIPDLCRAFPRVVAVAPICHGLGHILEQYLAKDS